MCKTLSQEPGHALLSQEGSAANAARGEVTLGQTFKDAALVTPARAAFGGAAPLTQGGERPFGIGLSSWRACALLLLLAVSITAQTRTAPARTYGYQIVKTYPHDATAFTQGLIYIDGYLYESTGLQGRSSIRKVDLHTGKVLQRYDVIPEYFAEGLTAWGSNLIQLTYQTHTGFVYDRATLKLKSSFPYEGEGWGLTHDGKRLIMSDGTSSLRFIDPVSFRETGRLAIRDQGKAVTNLNELEYVRGEIFANVWHADRIARISPSTGNIVGWIDLRGLLKPGEISPSAPMATEAVLNGIAYDASGDRLFITGKLWPKLFEIKIVPR